MSPDIALQLYTMREQMAVDAAACLHQVAEAGYAAVEFAGFGTLDAAGARTVLDETGLAAVGVHVDYEDLDADLHRVIDETRELGAASIVVAQARTQDFASADAVCTLAATFDGWGAACRDAGLAFGYHGYHDFDREFAPHGDSTRYDLLVRSTDPELVRVQLDTFWVRHVGDDPVAALHRYAGRVTMLHCKEAAASGSGDAPVGEGLIDWPAVIAAAAATGVGWLVVEQEDDPANAPRDIATSRANLERFRSGVAAG